MQEFLGIEEEKAITKFPPNLKLAKQQYLLLVKVTVFYPEDFPFRHINTSLMNFFTNF